MNVLQTLLDTHDWGDYTAMINDLKAWERWPLFMEAFHALDRSVLYQSPIHGEGHIERTMLFGALTARDERLSAADAGLLFDACAYHDVGRRDDSLDDDHGRRSALRLGEITGRAGDELHMLMGAVEAHSRDDADMTAVVQSYHPQDYLRARRLAEMLKDCDGLDRVRIHAALDPSYLRRPGSRWYVHFSEYLFSLYGKPKSRF